MNVLFDINHPAHVHLFKNSIQRLAQEGHRVTVTARDKDVTLRLLDANGLPYECLSKARTGMVGLAVELIIRQGKLFGILRRNKINVCVSVTGACSVLVCKILGIPSLVFYDTEHAKLQNALSIPLATRYITPDCYRNKPVPNQITYAGVHELAYCHPHYFQPDPSVFELLKISRDTKFVMLRFVSWGASHDRGQKGLSPALRRQLIRQLSPLCRLFIVSESALDAECAPYQINIPAEKIHDALYYASLYVGEGATMVSECACFGTPAIYVNSLKVGYVTEEDQKYGLVYDLEDEEQILTKALEIIKAPDKREWQAKRDRFLQDKIDVTGKMIALIKEFGQQNGMSS